MISGLIFILVLVSLQFLPLFLLRRSVMFNDSKLVRNVIMIFPWLALPWILCGHTTCKIIFEPNTELWSVAGHNELTTAKILLWRGANPNAKRDKVGSPLQYAVNNNHVEMVRLLLANGGDANATAGIWGDDSLAAAAAYKNFPEVLELLLKNGADANKGAGRNKPLAMACGKGNVECIKILLTHGAFLDSQDEMGVTPLQSATRFGCPNKDAVVKLLQDAAKTPKK